MDTTASHLKQQQRIGGPRTGAAFWRLMHEIAIAAGGTHVAFIVLFYGMGATTMAWINVGSVTLFAASYLCLKRRLNLTASALIVAEVLLHAVLAVRALGWDSGFHYYLVVVVPIVVISRMRYPALKSLWLALLIGLYIGMDHFVRGVTPYDTLSPEVLAITRYFNIAGTFLLIAHLSRTHLRLVRQTEREMRVLATTDPLTRLLNRRSMQEVAEYTIAELQRKSAPLAFVLTDIDHFKAINDQYGHAAGDAVLTAVSRALRDAVRAHDSVARWGGEEFLILMPDATLETACAVAERLRQQIAAIEVAFAGHLIKVSMTFGVSSHRANEPLDAPVSRADSALYRGKASGRNQVVTEAL